MNFMIPSSNNTSGMIGGENNRNPSLPNLIRFEQGKRKKELLSSERDEYIAENGEEGKSRATVTPKRRKKAKLLKTCPAQSFHNKSSVSFYNTNTRIWESKYGFQLKSSENLKSENTIYSGGSLDLLYDAIQVVEYQRFQKSVGVQVQEKDLISVLSDNVFRGVKNASSRSNLQSHPFWANASVEMDVAKGLGVEGKPRKLSDVKYNSRSILRAVNVDGSEGVLPQNCFKEKRLPKLPVKYSDSVLQPWKKVTRNSDRY